MQSDNVKDETSKQDVSDVALDIGWATVHFVRSAVDVWVGLVSVPLSLLPRQTRAHLQAAGGEFAHGLAALARGLADGLDEIAQQSREGAIGGSQAAEKESVRDIQGSEPTS
jgi:hypothetical protein